MPVVQLTFDEAIIEDYSNSFAEHYAIINNCIGMLESSPDDDDIINEVFRSLHTIKGNADMCQMDTVTQFTHALEDVVSGIRDGQLEYKPLIGETLLLCLDKTKEISQHIFDGEQVSQPQISAIRDQLQKLIEKDIEIESISRNIIQLISGHIVDDSNQKIIQSDESSDSGGLFIDAPPPKKVVDLVPCPYCNQEISEDSLDFLKGLKAWSLLMECKIPYWRGRLERTLPLAIAINEHLQQEIDNIQLEAAVYVHDVSFAFLSNHLLHKDSKFDANDVKEMQQHPLLSSNLLRHVQGWSTAALIVEQHHEKWDGSGYPNRLAGDQISTGAQILAVVDTYESMTSVRADRQYKRSILRAVTEINNCSGSQFNPNVVLAFNSVIKVILGKSR